MAGVRCTGAHARQVHRTVTVCTFDPAAAALGGVRKATFMQPGCMKVAFLTFRAGPSRTMACGGPGSSVSAPTSPAHP